MPQTLALWVLSPQLACGESFDTVTAAVCTVQPKTTLTEPTNWQNSWGNVCAKQSLGSFASVNFSVKTYTESASRKGHRGRLASAFLLFMKYFMMGRTGAKTSS
jgi:hypothetical protein